MKKSVYEPLETTNASVGIPNECELEMTRVNASVVVHQGQRFLT